MPVESLSASYDSLNGEEEEREMLVLSGESLMCSHTVSLQIRVFGGKDGVRQQTDNNPELCMSVRCEGFRAGWDGNEPHALIPGDKFG